MSDSQESRPKTVEDVRQMLKQSAAMASGSSDVDPGASQSASGTSVDATEPQDDPEALEASEAFLHEAQYDGMNVTDARAYVAKLDPEQQAIAVAYEQRNKGRSMVLAVAG